MARTREVALREITLAYMATVNTANPPSPATIQADILDETINTFQIENANRQPGEKWKMPTRLTSAQIADILMMLYPIVNIAFGGLNADPDYDVLAIYQTSGPNEGIYTTGTSTFYNLIHEYCYTLSDHDTKDTITMLEHRAPRVTRCSDKNLIAVNNGIFDYDTKQLMPFDKSLVFTSKSKVNYNPNATNVIIHNPDDNTDWDIESWMDDLFDDPEITNVVWEIIGAIIRPNVPWNKSAWFYSNTGNNGKGTLCELMRQITGDGTYASIPLSEFSKDFMLEPLLRASAIIVDENDVGAFIDKAANLKAIITNDVIQMNRKFKPPIAYQFKGFMVQCLNELPKIRDRSDSFYRRQLFVPFVKCFTGAERKYIKHDYMHRQDVLEYVLHKVLNTNYYTLSEPAACALALEEYKEFNDPVRQFIDEILPECQWDLVPYAFLYDLYKAWFKATTPNGTVIGRNTFIGDLNRLLVGNTLFYPIPNGQAIRPRHMMDAAEPLIFTYHLDAWMNPTYKGTEIDKLCHPELKATYKGILRYTNGETYEDIMGGEDTQNDTDF